MKHTIFLKPEEVPLSLPSGGHIVKINCCESLCLPKAARGKSQKIPCSVQDIAGKVLLFVFSLVVVGSTAAGVHPELAQSVAQLVQQENIEAAAENKHRREEILWLARIAYSESEFTEGQWLTAEVAMNRVKLPLFPNTVQEVALQPHQFSGLNHYDQWYEVNISRDYDRGDNVWESALRVAEEVYDMTDEERLLPADTTHFFSPLAVRKTPDWAIGKTPVKETYGRLGVRFAFYNDIM